MKDVFGLDNRGQAMIEAALMLPVFMSLFVALFYFSLRSEGQVRTAMAARHGAWSYSIGQGSKVEHRVKAFWEGRDQVDISKKKYSVELGVPFLSEFINLFTGGALKENSSVKVAYRQPRFAYAAPDPEKDKLFDFMTGEQKNDPIEVIFCDRTDYWKNTNKLLLKIIGNVF